MEEEIVSLTPPDYILKDGGTIRRIFSEVISPNL